MREMSVQPPLQRQFADRLRSCPPPDLRRMVVGVRASCRFAKKLGNIVRRTILCPNFVRQLAAATDEQITRTAFLADSLDRTSDPDLAWLLNC